MKVQIFNPLYSTDEGDTVGIWDKRVNDAVRAREPLLIVSKNGRKIFMPKWIRKNCPIIEKVYLRPNEPMREYKVFIPRQKPLTKDEQLKKLCQEYQL